MSAATAAVVDTDVAVSLITVAEIEYGMEAKNWGVSRRDLMRRFRDALRHSCRTWKPLASGHGSKRTARRRAVQSRSRQREHWGD
jgi:predicted nucleic acid-binding protein